MTKRPNMLNVMVDPSSGILSAGGPADLPHLTHPPTARANTSRGNSSHGDTLPKRGGVPMQVADA
ncbi:MAG TPA: hypothetical protein VNS34_10795 [Rhizobiaceae bacterium]|nr:hypothetical protein [Rhizobiaceae bacterium]